MSAKVRAAEAVRRKKAAAAKSAARGGAKKAKTPARETGVATGELKARGQSNARVVDVKLQTKTSDTIKLEIAGKEQATKAKAEAAAPPPRPMEATGQKAAIPAAPAPPKAPTPLAAKPKPAAKDDASKSAKPANQRQGFKLSEFVVYPAHGVGQIVAIEEQEVAGFRLELFVINFAKDKMTLRVPTSKVTGVGMRKISDPDTAKRSLDILSGRARIKRTMWSRRAQEYETKINSGDIGAIAEVVRDLYRSEAQPEQSYSERQLYEAALDRMVREIAAVNKSNEIDALKAIEAQLQKTHNRAKPPSPDVSDREVEEAA